MLTRAIVHFQYLLYIFLLLLIPFCNLNLKPQNLSITVTIHHTFSLLISSVLNPMRVEKNAPEIRCSPESWGLKQMHLGTGLKQLHLHTNHAKVWKTVLVDWQVFQASFFIESLEVYLWHFWKFKRWVSLHFWKSIFLLILLILLILLLWGSFGLNFLCVDGLLIQCRINLCWQKLMFGIFPFSWNFFFLTWL